MSSEVNNTGLLNVFYTDLIDIVNRTTQTDAGEQVALELMRMYGGTSVYLAKAERFERFKRDLEIHKKYNGRNLSQLAKLYNVSEQTIRNAVGRNMPKQSGLFD